MNFEQNFTVTALLGNNYVICAKAITELGIMNIGTEKCIRILLWLGIINSWYLYSDFSEVFGKLANVTILNN